MVAFSILQWARFYRQFLLKSLGLVLWTIRRAAKPLGSPVPPVPAGKFLGLDSKWSFVGIPT